MECANRTHAQNPGQNACRATPPHQTRPQTPRQRRDIRRPPADRLAAAFKKRDWLPLITYQDLTIQGLEFERRYSDYWNTTDVDAVIMPVAPTAAVLPGKYFHAGYTQVINLLNDSAVAIPVTIANKKVDVVHDLYQPKNEVDKASWEACKSCLMSFSVL